MYDWIIEADIYRIRKELRRETDRVKILQLQTQLCELQIKLLSSKRGETPQLRERTEAF
jgi:hypothetical protein